MTNKKQALPENLNNRKTWVTSVAPLSNQTHPSDESRMRTTICFDTRNGAPSIFLPPDMAQLQPRSLRYLHAFAEANKLQIVEDRRRVFVQPDNEKRRTTTPVIAKALAELLNQLGLPGKVRNLSTPHRLAADSAHIPIDELIRMAAYATPQAKHVVINPGRHMLDIVNGDASQIDAYGCKMISEFANTVLSLFQSPGLRGVGYSTGKQYVMHVCLAGGAANDTSMWADFHTFTRADFQFKLFQSTDAQNDLGLLFATYYLDLAGAPAPWWLNSWADSALKMNSSNEPYFLKRAS